jgi:AcrR family transcriptional regulator
MDTHTTESLHTRDRILWSATEIFAKNGFRNTTVRDICTDAEVNVAAVNYHFGSKEKLYESACARAFGLESKSVGQGFHISEDTPPEKQLHTFIHSLLRSFFEQSTTGHAGRIMIWEMNEPTGALDIIVEKMIRPRHIQLCTIIASLLGPAPSEETIKKCCFGIVGHCIHYRHARPVLERLYPQLSFDLDSIDAIADHITCFSLGALKHIAEQLKG